MTSQEIKDKYNYKKVSSKEGDFLDINVKLLLPKQPISNDDTKFMKVLLAEGMEQSKSESNDADTDQRFKNIYNSKILGNMMQPIGLYSLIILYKRIIRGKILEANSRKENLIPRFKGLAAVALLGFAYYQLFAVFEYGVNFERESYLKEMLGSDSIDEYEQFRKNYFLRNYSQFK